MQTVNLLRANRDEDTRLHLSLQIDYGIAPVKGREGKKMQDQREVLSYPLLQVPTSKLSRLGVYEVFKADMLHKLP